MHSTGLPDQTSSQMDAHEHSSNISLHDTGCSQNPTCSNLSPRCQRRILRILSRDRLLRELQNASVADLSESLAQPLQQWFPNFSTSSGRFIPRKTLLQILDSRRVAEHLETLLDGPPSPNEIADYISPDEGRTCHCGNGLCTGSRIILASLMHIEKEGGIIHCYNQPKPGLCDSSLPISDESLLPQLFNELTEKEKQLFRHAQSQLRCHYLRKIDPYRQRYTELDREAALPFSHIDERISPVDGELSVVRHVRIDPSHHNLGEEYDFALKTFKDSALSSVDFQEELQANQQVPRHDRIVPIHAALKYRQKFHFVLPFASGGNLEELWETYSTNNSPGSKPATWYSSQWLLTECLGIAESLAATHKPSTVLEHGAQHILPPQLHADVKPRNILCYGTPTGSFYLKLADFGVTRKVDENSLVKVREVPHTKTYRPPEYDVEDNISLNYDVWCLACIYLEFVTWAVLGGSEKEEFGKSRVEERHDPLPTTDQRGETLEDTFFKTCIKRSPWYDVSGFKIRIENQIKETTTKRKMTDECTLRIIRGNISISCKVKDSVTTHINKIRRHAMCDTAIRKFLDFIEAKMLVVDPGTRADSSDVEKFLRNLTNGE
ncbi:kinase-like protein [Xylaria bambusicola]|uniref:kinase-like protein n=1 Tax=Xylaria bambusicola TaxID=326684 RepID=UPI00200756E4|nr:kinase-like protein [Xylaria bambusicola]KAI0521589.1 kinase-like protein [Xylaria bambusicola]